DKYEVYVREGNGPEEKLEVLMSEAIHEGDFQSPQLAGRTFSFTQISYNFIGSPGLTFRVVKLFGTDADSASLHPRSYELTPSFDGQREVSFLVKSNQRYLSVDFHSQDNRSSLPPFMANKGVTWIEHMLCIFVDPPEPRAPSGAGVVTFSPSVAPNQLTNASTIVFPAGYHNLNDYNQGGIIDSDGVLKVQDDQSLYLAGGAFVEGLIDRENFNNDNQRIYGRGILTGRQYLWRSHPDHSGRDYREIIKLGNAEIEGIMVMESPNHGVVGRTVHIKNFKYLGWHANNDGVRIGARSEVEHSFMRCVDDHFYNFDNYIHDCVLWAGHNGSIMTYGWGGLEGSNTYNSGSSFMDNVDIIHPEWSGLGNNNGLIMAQVGLDYTPFDYGTNSTLTHFRNIRMEGRICALTNLKPRSGSNGVSIAVQVPADDVGYLGDLLLENITVDEQIERGRIRGIADASTTGSETWYVQNVTIRNVQIGGQCVDESNQGTFFDIDPNTTRDLSIGECALSNRRLSQAVPSLGKIFPLSSGQWQIENLGPTPLQFEVFNLQGQRVLELQEFNGEKLIRVNHLPQGLYLARFSRAGQQQSIKIKLL
ncbi:MAG: T9SS type A sorting domain-containing protein, partial [Bacteroidota bacterium]